MNRRVCLAIGVSDVVVPSGRSARFAYLDGAVEAANAVGQWALRSGFGDANVAVVNDAAAPDGAPQPVTAQRVQQSVDALFPAGALPVSHLILHFCGHGLTDAVMGSMFWLFSDALDDAYKINVDTFIEQLLTFGVERVSLISDACRDGPADLDLMRLESRRGIRGRSNRVVSPMFDRLIACQDGSKAHMVLDPASADPGKCILSGVALDVLGGGNLKPSTAT